MMNKITSQMLFVTLAVILITGFTLGNSVIARLDASSPAYAVADSFSFPMTNYTVTARHFGQEVEPGRFHLGEDVSRIMRHSHIGSLLGIVYLIGFLVEHSRYQEGVQRSFGALCKALGAKAPQSNSN